MRIYLFTTCNFGINKLPFINFSFSISNKTGQCIKSIFTRGTACQSANESGHMQEWEINNPLKVFNDSNIKMR
jgi:hypothetical protein